jgi:myo-inositol 2-dehydrogenase/D-chiro-inositol 1-dehydrogenase
MGKQIAVGIIGAGRIGMTHAKSIAYEIPGAYIKIVADPYITEESTLLMNKLGVQHVTKDYREIIQDPDIQAVIICSSTATHAPISQEAALAGKHIFCEKPIDLDIAKIVDTLQVVQKAQVKFQVGFNRRFDHNFYALKKRITEQQIGNIHMVNITSRDPAPPPISYIEVSGGIYTDMMVHDFDMARFLVDSEVEEVYAAASVKIDPRIGEAGDYDTATATLKFKNGVIAMINNSRQAVYGYDQRVEVFGEKGAVSIQNDTPATTVLSNADGVISEKPKYFFLERYMDAFTEEKRQFFAAIEEGTEVPVGGLDGLYSVVIAAAANLSVKENRPVKIDEIFDFSTISDSK